MPAEIIKEDSVIAVRWANARENTGKRQGFHYLCFNNYAGDKLFSQQLESNVSQSYFNHVFFFIIKVFVC